MHYTGPVQQAGVITAAAVESRQAVYFYDGNLP